MRRYLIGGVAFALLVAGCGGGDSGAQEATPAPATTVSTATPTPTTTVAPTTTATTQTATTTTMVITTTGVSEPALSADDGTYSIVWARVTNPFWSPNAGTTDDPFFFIHTRPDQDGFYFSLEMYTTEFALWQGELGGVAVICNEGSPAPNSTGICTHFDPDGPGPLGDLNADFAAVGSITINQFDDGGYDIVVDEIVFSDGSKIAGFELAGP